MASDLDNLRALRDKLKEELRSKKRPPVKEGGAKDVDTGKKIEDVGYTQKEGVTVSNSSSESSKDSTVLYIKIFAAVFFIGVLIYVVNDKSSSEKYGSGVKRVQENSGNSRKDFGIKFPNILESSTPIRGEKTNVVKEKEKAYGLGRYKVNKTKIKEGNIKSEPVKSEPKKIKIKEEERTELVIKTERLLESDKNKIKTKGFVR